MNGKKGKKLTSEILSVRTDGKSGGTAFGYFECLEPMFTQDNQPVKGNFDQDLYTFTLRQPDGELLRYWADGGIRGALKMAKVTQGQCIMIEHTGTKKIEEGTVQTYDIFGYEFDETNMPKKKSGVPIESRVN